MDHGKAGSGKGGSGKGVQYMAGFSDISVPNWLNSDDLQRLNTYGYDPVKAGQLLQAAGWQKNGDSWWTPAGSPGNRTITTAPRRRQWPMEWCFLDCWGSARSSG